MSETNQIDVHFASRLGALEASLTSQNIRVTRQEEFQKNFGEKFDNLVRVVDKLASHVEQANKNKFSVTKIIQGAVTIKGLIALFLTAICINCLPEMMKLINGG